MSTARLTRHLPGRAMQRNPETGLPVFVNGVVEQVTRNSILIKTNSKEIGQAIDHGHIRLIGETYIYWCAKCATTVWELERPADGCPHCKRMCEYLKPGDKIRLHYRGDQRLKPDGSPDELHTWGSWWAERWDW